MPLVTTATAKQPLTRISASLLFNVLYFVTHMKVIASLRKQTKSGVSTWTFIHDAEMQMHYAVGGRDLKVIPAKDRKHLRQIFDNFVSYGYSRKLVKKQVINDPWASSLPAQMQMELEALASA